MSKTFQTLLTQTDSGVFQITINRPEKMNALNRLTFSELKEALESIQNDVSIKAVVITGAGDKAFVAGADISEFSSLNKTEAMNLARNGQIIFQMIENFPKPVIAAVNGFALGGGCELALACHIRIASENAKFGLPEVTLGLLPGYGGTQRMTQLVGRGKALELMLTGNMISAADALPIGLVNHVVPAFELKSKCAELTARIIQLAPLAQQHIIGAANAAVYDPQNGYEREVQSFGALFETEDFKEGTGAFMEKRKPTFKGE